jgi:tRNA (cytidine/uridine-2'-O-)-methyltransferase
VDVVLIAPEIATNTGNIIRLCANTGAALHLVEPLGFTLQDRLLRRAGLDYHEYVKVAVHSDLAACVAALHNTATGPRRWFALSSAARNRYDSVEFAVDDVIVFGAERSGLTPAQLDELPGAMALRIPMRPDNRSLNLANAVAVVVYEAWRQHDFEGGTHGSTTSETPAGPTFDR